MTSYTNQDSFDQPIATERGGGRPFLFGCGGLSLIGFLICCCCVVVVGYAFRQPEAVVVAWGVAAQQDWSLADRVVCDNSRAAVLTDRYKELGVTITDFTAQSREDAENTIVVTGSLDHNGTTQNWEATFYMLEEGSGIFPVCINNIDVTRGDIAGGTDDIDNPDQDAENAEADEENATSDE